MKSLFKDIYLLRPQPSWIPERQILIWSQVKPSDGSKNTQETETLGPKPLMCGVWLTQITAVYIQLFQWFVMISLFSSSKPPRPVCNKQTSPILWSALSGGPWLQLRF